MLSLFVLGFASTASADSLTDANGEPVETGSKITLTSNNLVSTFSGGVFSSSCKVMTGNAEVTENGPEQVVLAPLGFSVSSCSLTPSSAPVYVFGLSFFAITLSEGEGNSTYGTTENVPALGLTCSFGGPVGFSYEAESDTISIPGSTVPKTGGTAGCPESKELHGDFKMKNGLGPVTIG